MANLGFNFKPDDVPDANFEPIPVGEYVGMITSSDLKNTKAGDGQFIEMDVQIVEGQYSGRILKERLNIKNKNEKAVEIAYQTLKKICNAINKTSVSDTEELHNIRLIVRVDIEKSSPYMKDGIEKEGNLQNVIKGYKAMKDREAPASSADSSPQNGEKKMPWQK